MKKILLLHFVLQALLFSDENKLLFFGNCIACHGEVSGLAAPRLIEVKGYYLMKYPKKEKFIAYMAEWLSWPNDENALLPKAVKKHKLMPYLAIDRETLEKISTYIYENDDFGVIEQRHQKGLK